MNGSDWMFVVVLLSPVSVLAGAFALRRGGPTARILGTIGLTGVAAAFMLFLLGSFGYPAVLAGAGVCCGTAALVAMFGSATRPPAGAERPSGGGP